MRSYKQYCAVAKALDLVGDRWTMLIVRELLVRGACRYTDLKNGLPGIATNMLGDRLAAMEKAGLVSRGEKQFTGGHRGPPLQPDGHRGPPLQPDGHGGPPLQWPRGAATPLFQLTERGSALEAVLHALGAWGGPLLAKPVKTDAFQTHWLALPARLHLKDHAPWSAPVTIEVRTGDDPMLIEAAGGAVHIRFGAATHPSAVMTGSPHLVVGVLTGGMTLNDAAAWGLQFEGDPGAVRRVQPKAGDGAALQQGLFPAG